MIQQDARQLLENGQDWVPALKRLGDLNVRISLVATGGGSGAIAKCFCRAGASKCFVEATVPYSRGAARNFLGRTLDSPSVSEETAIELAAMAHQRAGQLADDQSGVPVGIALTAALPTDPPRDHRSAIYVALVSERKSETWQISLATNDFDRRTAEQVADAMILQALNTL
ncbi:MAG: CinA family protein [Rubripirellula sp.]|nr:CinA family protein [Rubripirellula sp.]